MDSKSKYKQLEKKYGVGSDFDGDGVAVYDLATENDIVYYSMDELFDAYIESGGNAGGVYDYNDPGDFSGHGQVEYEPYKSAEEWLDDTPVIDIEIFAIEHYISTK